VWDSFVSRGHEEIIPFPESFGMLNSMMNGGIAHGEITIVGALTSVGKTTMVNEILYNLLVNTNKKIGGVFLEASLGEVVEGLLGIHTDRNLTLEDKKSLDYSALRKSFDTLVEDEKLYLLDHNGAVDADELFLKLRALIKGQGCEVILIDPLQAGVTSNENGTIDAFMDKTLKLVKETNASIIIVSHMRKPSAKNPHDVSEYDTKGSGSINQIAFNTILLSRDKFAESEVAKNSTMVRLAKCRRTGVTGEAGWLFYNNATGRIERGESPELMEANAIEEF
jgi:replicative DNA helicase